MSAESVLLATACCGPVFYFSQILLYRKVYIEQHEHFIKQTYRNRYPILGPNGKASLTVPVEQGRKPGLKIRDVRIAYFEAWQRNHWRSLEAAYHNSPWFRDMEEEIRPFYMRKWDFLFDFNLDYLHKILDLLGISKEIFLTEGFETIHESFDNFREVISPKKDPTIWNPGYVQPFYTQVFSDRFPFIPGLSILDLLFNEGPLAREKLI
jgi:WbqC-like protein family